MRLLLSRVNSRESLVGYDWDRDEVFWSVPKSSFSACGICYWRDRLLVASNDTLLDWSPRGMERIPLPGRHPSLAHSVGRLDADRIGVVDTGNSVVRVFDEACRPLEPISPLAGWGELPSDAIHLNDFAATKRGVIGSCFDHRPWRAAERSHGNREDWRRGGYGLLLNLSGPTPGRIVACGLNHPHSVTADGDGVCVCSSATGEFVRFEFDHRGRLQETSSIEVTTSHFLRGALRAETGWFLGGSATRHGDVVADHAALFHLDTATGKVTSRPLPFGGEIYDILPWRENVIDSLLELA